MLNQLKYLLPPVLFWRFYAAEFYQDQWQHRIFPQHRWLLKIIQKLKPNHILEVGCGFGRNLKFLLGQGIAPQKLTGVDFTSRLLSLAKTSLPASVDLHRAPAQNLPFSSRKFDLVFTHGLLMHISPPRLTQTFTELVRVSRKWLVLIEEIRHSPQRLNSFTWAHYYPQLISQFKLKILDQHRDNHNLAWYLLQKS